MNRPELEDRLRAAYQARAAQVSEADLRPAVDLAEAADASTGPRRTAGDATPGRRHRVRVVHLGHRWTMPLLAAAAVVAVVAGGITAATLAGGTRHAPVGTHTPGPLPTPSTTATVPTTAPTTSPTTPPPSPSTHRSTSRHAEPTMLASGRQGTRDQIPWSAVGPGWTVALWSADAPSDEHPAQDPTLYLVDPVGGRYVITTVPTQSYVSVEDWSGDHLHVLLNEAGATSNVILQVDTQTGDVSRVATLSQFGSAAYTRPSGRSILVDDTTGSLELGLDGQRGVSFGRHVEGSAGNPYPARSLGAPDGSAVLFGGTNALEYVSATDQPIRTLPAPAGSDQCSPVRWWASGTALVTCTPAQGSNTMQPDLWLFHLDGTAPTRLTDSAAAQTELGFVDAYEIGGITYVAGQTGCGGGTILNRLGTGATTTAIHTPFGPADTNPVQVAGSTTAALIVIPIGGCQADSRPLLAFDPATGQVQTLLGGTLNGGWVIDAKSAES